jgi:hypothetical protein
MNLNNSICRLCYKSQLNLEFSVTTKGKYPPAKPEALVMEPLKAAVGVADAAPMSLAA